METAMEMTMLLAMEAGKEAGREAAWEAAWEGGYFKGGGKKGGKGKGKAWVGTYEPRPWDQLYFNESQAHAFYNYFPDGEKIDVADYEIDLEAPITVLQATTEKIEVDHRWYGRRTHTHVAVSFETRFGIVWTNFSRNGIAWMRFTPE